MKLRLLILLFVLIGLTSCTLGGSSTGPFTVEFETNGGTLCEAITVEKNATFELPITEKAGFVFQGWFLNNSFTIKFNNDSGVTKNIKLYAKWGQGIEISTLEELLNVKNDLNANYILVNDIDCGGIAFHSIGTSETDAFSGVFDGQGYSITNFSATDEMYLGIFGYNTGTIKNLNISNVSIKTVKSYKFEYVHAGLIAGYNTGTIETCYVNSCAINVSVTDSGSRNSNCLIRVGLITGTNYGQILNCIVTGSAETKNWELSSKGYIRAGGITGENNGNIENCFVNASIVSSARYGSGMLYGESGEAGGITGVNNTGAVIENSVVLGSISANYKCGDISARNSGEISNCYISSSVSTTKFTYLHGSVVELEQLANSQFYSLSLNWDTEIWDYNNINFDEGKYPSLYQNR